MFVRPVVETISLLTCQPAVGTKVVQNGLCCLTIDGGLEGCNAGAEVKAGLLCACGILIAVRSGTSLPAIPWVRRLSVQGVDPFLVTLAGSTQ